MATVKFTFSNGVEAQLRSVAPNVFSKIAATVTGRPEAPMVEVTGPGGKPRLQKDLKDPAYLAALEEYQGRVLEAWTKYMITVGCQLTVDEAAVAEFVAQMREFDPNMSFEGESPKYIYVNYILIDSPAELERLSLALKDVSGFKDILASDLTTE